MPTLTIWSLCLQPRQTQQF